MIAEWRWGETDDPADLVPGDPEALRREAASWHTSGQQLRQGAEQLRGLSAPSWRGKPPVPFKTTSSLCRSAGETAGTISCG